MSVDPLPALATLRLLQLVSPSLPVGAFTYSQGLEWAVERDWVRDEATLAAWLADLLDGPLAATDLPLLARLHAAADAGEPARFAALAAETLAWRETAELRAEERQKGRALCAVLDGLGDVPDDVWRDAVASGYLAGFAWAAARWAIPAARAAEGYAYGWLENQVIAAVKLVPLGQAAGQRVLHRLAGHLPARIADAFATDDAALGSSATALAIASACHESQYTRLYRS
ncbi:MAG: urease accessory UreF family protein [Gammaproteobacteria bacterium]|nr:urease accessory UreF family protein [Gammaproteobacteria bacterium]